MNKHLRGWKQGITTCHFFDAKIFTGNAICSDVLEM